MKKIKNRITIPKILNVNWLNLICLKYTEHSNEFNAVLKLRMQSIVHFLSCCILTWIECLIFNFVFVVIGMYNLILLTSSICLVDRYEETPVLQNVYG